MSVPASVPKRSGRRLLRHISQSGIRNWASYSSNSTTSPIFLEFSYRCLHDPPWLLPTGATVVGRVSHPLEEGAFPWRTEKCGLAGKAQAIGGSHNGQRSNRKGGFGSLDRVLHGGFRPDPVASIHARKRIRFIPRSSTETAAYHTSVQLTIVRQ